MTDVFVGKEAEFGDRERKIVVSADAEIGVFRVAGAYYAYENNCAHQGGPICQGRILNKVEEVLDEGKRSQGLRFSDSEVHVVCPWHGYEYSLRTGRHPGDKNIRLRPYDVKVKDGDVYVVV